ncbi:hypothetical protein PYJP_06760 [Pyrofollis japonicus]|uniref:ATP-binding cassette domain-containing protein n=1 Tax=Pyrofollis japonicus TaxID=3060460 RepID=UPI00295B8B77|nr:ATP-binding cassette domain-containing protein [Pyrofollis japonicus]BEP17324.1 hypothetical protein PYJP_06760 [Pyrofollis japonicus]
MLRLQGVVKKYSGKVVLGDVSLALSRGVVLLVGPNGSGKSTLLRVVAGLLVPDKGEASCGSRKVYVPETVPRRSFVNAFDLCEVIGDCDHEFLAKLAKELGVYEILRKSFRRCSMGEARKLFISSVLAAAWRDRIGCILVDEPFANLDSFSRRKLWGILLEYREEKGVSVMMLASHVVDGYMVQEATHVAALRDGHLYMKPVDELRHEVERYRFYLGPSSMCSRIADRGTAAIHVGDYCLIVSEEKLGENQRVHGVDLFSNTDALYAYITSISATN